ncbi:hypothetical protein IEQ34_012923 [Dendrobium chrysotoxum]|uniref:Uncharacterized protein n=1 Tax=Dendrobium chrysotoxum TaxID=161865 RepID=A0AAV7GQ08_DENCH|nr:hypothetical protein IEQ34_012923 [Dendrobium chrysotoxum]
MEVNPIKISWFRHPGNSYMRDFWRVCVVESLRAFACNLENCSELSYCWSEIGFTIGDGLVIARELAIGAASALSGIPLGLINTEENEANRSLDLPRCDSRLLVVSGEARRLLGEFLEDVVNEGVHDAHRLARDPDVWVNLLQNLKDINLVSLGGLLGLLLLLIARSDAFFCCRKAFSRPRFLSRKRFLRLLGHLCLLLLLLHRLLSGGLLLSELLLCLWSHWNRQSTRDETNPRRIERRMMDGG